MDNLKFVLDAQDPKPQRIFIGVSGGLDSVVLLHMLVTLDSCLRRNDKLIILHVNHHLQKEADVWETFVVALAQKYNLPIAVGHLHADDFVGENLEAKARAGRYAFFEKHLTQADDYLLLAQHEQDQVETFFFNLQRGAGLAGLCAMPIVRPFGKGRLLRPLLHTTRKDLEDYANTQKLTWMEDPSNQEIRFNRNFLRQSILPKLRERWPHFDEQVAHAIGHLQEARVVLEGYLAEDLIKLGNPLDLKILKSLPPERHSLLLQSWIKTHTGKVLSDKQLQVILMEVIAAASDRHPHFTIPGLRIERKKHWLLLA